MKLFRLTLLSFLILIGLLSETSAQDNLIIKRINFYGNDSIKKEILLKQMNTKPLTFPEKMTFWKKHSGFSTFTFDEDIIRLKKYYQQNGFLNPGISYDLKPDKRKRKLDITLRIKEGKAILIDEISYHLPVDFDNIQLLDSIKKTAPTKADNRFRDENILATEKIIHHQFSSKGYPFVKVEKDIKLKQQNQQVDVFFTINPGKKSYFGAIELQGDSLIPSSYINKHIGIKKGTIFSQTTLEETQEELFELALFRYVTIRAIMDSVKNEAIPIVIQLKELPRWSIKTGLGYGTEDRVRISMLLTRLNFMGGGRSLTVKGQHSYFIPLSIETKFIQPDVWKKDLDFILNPYFSREREESYQVDRLGTAITLQKDFAKKSAAYISYAFGKDKVELNTTNLTLSTKNPEQLNHNKSGITVGYNLNTTDDLFSPSKGWKTNLMATYMGIGFNTEYHYYKLMGEAVFFQPLGKQIVFAGKLKAGVIDATQGDLLTPIEDRFLMGGALSLRGWGRNQISPEDESGNKLGGNSMLEGSAELRFPLYGIFSVTAFMDFGNNWKNSWDFSLSGLYYDAGIGLRIKTPVGPVRFDFATPLTKEKFNIQFFVSIGHAF